MRSISGSEDPDGRRSGGERWEPSLIPDTVRGSASSLRTTEQCSRQADTHRKCVMKRPMNISVGNMLVNLKLSSVILLLNVVSTISSLSLTAIEVPKYAKVNVRCQMSVSSLSPATRSGSGSGWSATSLWERTSCTVSSGTRITWSSTGEGRETSIWWLM